MAKKAAKRIAKLESPVLPSADVSATQSMNEPVAPIEQKPTSKSAEVTVCDMRGNPHRTYTLEIHGSRFRELAEMFISDRPGWFLRE
jgi:hypothetical protein